MSEKKPEKDPPKKVDGKIVAPWERKTDRDPMKLRDKQVADEVMEHPERPMRKIAKGNGMTLYQMEQTLQRGPVRDYIIQKMDKAGATVEKATRVFSEAMDANKHVMVSGGSKDNPAIFDEKPDHAIRIKAAEGVLRVHGFISNVKGADGQPGGGVSALVAIIREQRKERGLDES